MLAINYGTRFVFIYWNPKCITSKLDGSISYVQISDIILLRVLLAGKYIFLRPELSGESHYRTTNWRLYHFLRINPTRLTAAMQSIHRQSA